jgi:SAM-dependent methyltransferase
VHARLLAKQGLHVVGIDIAPSLVAYCREQAAGQGLASARFEQGDMRELAYKDRFDAALLLSGSFGFFDDETNLDVLGRLARSLRSDGRVLIDVFDPGEMMVRPTQRTWSRYGEGFGLRTTWWEPETCTYMSEFQFIDAGGVLNTAAEPERIRVYSVPEWRANIARVGLQFTHILGDTKLPLVKYDREHYTNLVIVGRKP